MSYTSIVQKWSGEQWGDGGVYWSFVQPTGSVSDDVLTITQNEQDGTEGVTTSASSTVLHNTNASYTTDEFEDYYLTYISGPAAGLSETITSNTSTTVTTPAFPVDPTSGGGDSYAITQFPVVNYFGKATVTASSDGNVSWNTWTTYGGGGFS